MSNSRLRNNRSYRPQVSIFSGLHGEAARRMRSTAANSCPSSLTVDGMVMDSATIANLLKCLKYQDHEDEDEECQHSSDAYGEQILANEFNQCWTELILRNVSIDPVVSHAIQDLLLIDATDNDNDNDNDNDESHHHHHQQQQQQQQRKLHALKSPPRKRQRLDNSTASNGRDGKNEPSSPPTQRRQRRRRLWTKLEAIHCTGDIASICRAIADGTNPNNTSRVMLQSFSFTGSVPIAHNPRYILDARSLQYLGQALQNIPCSSSPASLTAASIRSDPTLQRCPNEQQQHQKQPATSICSYRHRPQLYDTSFPYLSTLSLKGTRLCSTGLRALSEGISQSETLHTLRISYCAMSVYDVSTYLAKLGLKYNRHLKTLLIAHCKLLLVQPPSKQSISAKASSADEQVRMPVQPNHSSSRQRSHHQHYYQQGRQQQQQQQQQLQFEEDEELLEQHRYNYSTNTFPNTVDCIADVVEALVDHPTLEWLSIYEMVCTRRATRCMGKMLQSPTTRLTHLGLKNNLPPPPTSTISTTTMEAVADVTTTITTTVTRKSPRPRQRRKRQFATKKSRSDNNNYNDDHGSDHVGDEEEWEDDDEDDESIQKLDITPILTALQTNTSLTSLHVSGNNINDKDMHRFAVVLSTYNCTLLCLALPANNLTSDGVLDFAQYVVQMKGLRSLDIQRNNPYSPESKQALITTLETNMEIERLDIDGTYSALKSYYTYLNRGGRRLLRDADTTVGNSATVASSRSKNMNNQKKTHSVPLGLWPLVLERAANANRLLPRGPHFLSSSPLNNRGRFLSSNGSRFGPSIATTTTTHSVAATTTTTTTTSTTATTVTTSTTTASSHNSGTAVDNGQENPRVSTSFTVRRRRRLRRDQDEQHQNHVEDPGQGEAAPVGRGDDSENGTHRPSNGNQNDPSNNRNNDADDVDSDSTGASIHSNRSHDSNSSHDSLHQRRRGRRRRRRRRRLVNLQQQREEDQEDERRRLYFQQRRQEHLRNNRNGGTNLDVLYCLVRGPALFQRTPRTTE